MNKPICYRGHDCARCLTYLATINNDEGLRNQSQKFYQAEFGITIPLKELHCLGGRSKELFFLCKSCPFIKCCKEHHIEMCIECSEYPCKNIKEYQEKYVNKCNQIN